MLEMYPAAETHSFNWWFHKEDRMRKILAFGFVIVVLLFASCSPNSPASIAIPGWLQDDWGATDGTSTVVVSCTEDNIQLYFNNVLMQDLKSSLAMNLHVVIDSQHSTGNSYQIRLHNTTSSLNDMTITFLYTAETDTVQYKEYYTHGGTGNIFILRRL